MSSTKEEFWFVSTQLENDCLQRAISYFKDLPFDMGLVISTSSVAQVDLKCLDFYFTIYKLLCTY